MLKQLIPTVPTEVKMKRSDTHTFRVFISEKRAKFFQVLSLIVIITTTVSKTLVKFITFTEVWTYE